MERRLKRKRDAAERRIIRDPEVERRTGYSRTQRWRLEKVEKFPQRVQLTENGAVGWYEDEIDEWILSRIRRGGRRPLVQWRGGRSQREGDETDPLAARQSEESLNVSREGRRADRRQRPSLSDPGRVS